MWLWLDDVRPMPRGYHARAWTAEEAIQFIETGNVSHISFDHDLGNEVEQTGYDVAKFIEEGAYFDALPYMTWEIHSDNGPGRVNIRRAMEQADKYWHDHGAPKPCGSDRYKGSASSDDRY